MHAPRDHDQGPGVGLSMCEARNAVYCSGARHSQQHAGLLGEEATCSCSVAGRLLVAEAEEPDALSLRSSLSASPGAATCSWVNH